MILAGHDRSCVMAMLPEPLASQVRGFGACVPDEFLADDGREDEPHITVLYGLFTKDSNLVSQCLQGCGQVRATLGRTNVFVNENIVLKIDVESQGLTQLHDRLKQLSNDDKHPEYQPHVTIAYLKGSNPFDYVQFDTDMFDGVSVTFDKLLFSTPNDKRYWIQIG